MVKQIELSVQSVNTLRPGQNGRRYPDDIFKCIFLNENICIPINISLKFVPKGQIKNIPSLVQIMAWRRPGDKPLFEPMLVNLVTHICITRPQWVNNGRHVGFGLLQICLLISPLWKFLMMKKYLLIFDDEKIPVMFFESLPYLTGVTALELWRHLSNTNVIFN